MNDTQPIRMITNAGERYASLSDLSRWAMLMQTLAADRELPEVAVWCDELLATFEQLAVA